jgi:TolB-like protein
MSMRDRHRTALASCVLAVFLICGCSAAGSPVGKTVLREVPRKDRVALMVLNFRNVSVKEKAAAYEPWEFGIPSMIITDLESIGVFNILSWHTLRDILEQQAFQSLGVVDEKGAVEIGKIAAARYLLTGSFMVMNGTLRIESKLFSVEDGTLLGAASASGGVDRFFELQKRLVLEMTARLGTALTPDEENRLAGNIETKSVDASLDNYAGEMALIRADRLKGTGKSDAARELIREAKARFQGALGHDPGYQRAKTNLSGLAMAIPKTL